MPYSVIGGDGKEYGPVEEDQLRQWLAEGRLTLESTIKDFGTSQTMTLASLPGFGPTTTSPSVIAPPPAYGNYPRPVAAVEESVMPLVWIIVRCVLAIVLFFVLHGIGVIIAGYALFSAFELKGRDSKWGVAALIVTILTLVAILIGWGLRLSGAGV